MTDGAGFVTLDHVTTDSDTTSSPHAADHHGCPEVILCAVDDQMVRAWRTVADGHRLRVSVHEGSILDTGVDAVVSPANSHGFMRGGIDAVYARAFPDIEHEVRHAVLHYHGGELPVGQAVIVPTGVDRPPWLISAPTMREPGEMLAVDTVHPYLAARAVFELWRDGTTDNRMPVRQVVESIAMPGLGTGVGNVDPGVCARQVAVAWDEVFGMRIPPAR